MTGLCVTVLALLAVSAAASRSEAARRTLFKKAMLRHSLTLAKNAPSPPPGAPEAAPMAAPAGSPAGACECNFEAMCTCETAMAHLDCISKTCANEECDCPAVQFSQSCGQIASVCKPMLDISCTPEEASCDGKFYQMSTSLTGLSIDLEKIDQDAHCGATGKCTGKIDVRAAIHNAKEGMQMECVLEETPGSKTKHTCIADVSEQFANCTMPMPKMLPAGDKLEGFCRVVDTKVDDNSTDTLEVTRLTHDAPFYIYNHHKAIEEEPKKKFAEAPPAPVPVKSNAFGTQGITMAFMVATMAVLFM
eukprot:gnl/MRDRNA2_/MRDRNA2_94899_c0_seq1.p1 gnl/MRDRNA2_/MRDRNA2_94899_c0~~gnl/MRDRNA2_/MRDRNA2_94899_c0_seq1.p1  ORF type:complete len:336 (+),score=70.23 gnl/MRDRNA2_/MRDRNA2_94899_c0_seq1:96-1010(+)